jgi:hypothetical protein
LAFRLRQLVFLLVVLTIVVVHGPAHQPPRLRPSAKANAEAGRHNIDTSQDQRTGAPDRTDDAVWQSASQNVTTNGPRLQSDKHHARAATLLHHRMDALAADERARELGNASRDRSPRHSIPLLI